MTKKKLHEREQAVNPDAAVHQTLMKRTRPGHDPNKEPADTSHIEKSDADINLWDASWNYSDSDSLDALSKAGLRYYTQSARELGVESPADPKFLNKLEDRLEAKSVPYDVIDKIIFRMRLKGKQIDKKSIKQEMTIREARDLVNFLIN